MDLSISGTSSFQVISPISRYQQAKSAQSVGRNKPAGLEEKTSRVDSSPIAAQEKIPARSFQPVDPAKQSQATEQLLSQLKETAIPAQTELQLREISAKAQSASAPVAYGQTGSAAAVYAGDSSPRQIDAVI